MHDGSLKLHINTYIIFTSGNPQFFSVKLSYFSSLAGVSPITKVVKNYIDRIDNRDNPENKTKQHKNPPPNETDAWWRRSGHVKKPDKSRR